ncbi:hypothetical protein [Stenotrophomonas geniculata]|uniref:hypothetical protein n=1 Tax=Stenotrophomonas geniculata TaxID=86188 RepID=UPI003D962F7A
MSRAIDVQQMLQNEIELAHCKGPRAGDARARRLQQIAILFRELRAAAHASLVARDLADQLAADDRLRAALVACEPTDTDHNREAVDGLCVEENDDEQ